MDLRARALEISTALLLEMPEYLKEWAFIKFPGSEENCTAPLLLVRSRFTMKELLSLIKCQIRVWDIFIGYNGQWNWTDLTWSLGQCTGDADLPHISSSYCTYFPVVRTIHMTMISICTYYCRVRTLRTKLRNRHLDDLCQGCAERFNKIVFISLLLDRIVAYCCTLLRNVCINKWYTWRFDI